jgi:hypothetical protein
MADAASPPPSSSSYGYAISLGSCVAGIPVKLHYSFFLLLLLEFASSLMNYRIGDDRHPMYILLVVVQFGPILLLTILVRFFPPSFATTTKGNLVSLTNR